MNDDFAAFRYSLTKCDICHARFAATNTSHEPRPIVWFAPEARVLIAGQAPGMRVHQSGKPFTDPSGDRLRNWMGIGEDTFYDLSRIAIVPMAFCFPGYNEKGADLPPPPVCAKTWHDRILRRLPNIELMLLAGGHAQKHYLGASASGGVTRTVEAWRVHAPHVFPLPHPSWRNNAWIMKNPWFETELLPALRSRLKEVLDPKGPPGGV